MYSFRQKIITINLTILVLVLLSCEEKKQPQEYIAKVGSSILTKETLDGYLSGEKNKNKFRNEFIREWVDEEVLYLEAEDRELTNSKHYSVLLEAAKRQIAGSMLLEHFFEENFSRPSDTELQSFYETVRESFVLADDGYILNIYEFNNEQSALDFRNTALQSSWENAEKIFSTDSSVVYRNNKSFIFGYRISPLDLSRSVKALYPGEISLVIQKEPSLFTVVQLDKIIYKDTVPDFNLVKNQVEEIYFYQKRQELFRKYLEQLYSKYNVELKKVDE